MTEEDVQRPGRQQTLDPLPGKAHDGGMTVLKIHYDGWLKLPAGLLRAIGAKAGDTLEASPREDGLVLRARGGKTLAREPQVADPASAEDTPSAPGAAQRKRASSPAKASVAPPSAQRAGGRRKARAVEPSG